MYSLIKFVTRRRQLHTIVSREIIKPCSPTPPHLKTYNLAPIDQICPSIFIPIVTFYQNTDDKTLDLKKSLSKTLTRYYPFAGRHAKVSPNYVDCNDEGADFFEASVDTTLTEFLQNSQHEDLNQCFPHGRVFNSLMNIQSQSDDSTVIPLAVQVNNFKCGGAAVAVSLSHKIADASSSIHFLNDWAKETQICSKKEKHDIIPPIDPLFITCEKTNINISEVTLNISNDDCVTRSFMFPNSKINDLKRKAVALSAESGQPITNPTRIEALTWLLYKCSVAAATKNNNNNNLAGPYKPSGLRVAVNLRDKMIQRLPEHTIGNIVSALNVETKSQSEMNPGCFIGQFRKKKMEIGGIKDIQTVHSYILNNFWEPYADEQQNKIKDYYECSSICRSPAYDIDFGWGKPVKATSAGHLCKNSFVLMDGPNGDGSIEALVSLGKQDLEIVQTDPELLSYIS